MDSDLQPEGGTTNPHPLFGEMLLPREVRFVEEYLIDLNGTQAAIRAGYSPQSAKSTARDLLQRPRVEHALAAAQAKRSKRTGITADRVLEELAKIGFSNMADYMRPDENGKPVLSFDNLTRSQMAALAEVTVEDDKIRFKLADKLGALTQIGRHLGMFSDTLTIKPSPFDGFTEDQLQLGATALAAAIAHEEANARADASEVGEEPASELPAVE